MTFSVCVRRSVEEGTAFGAAVATDAPAVGALAPYTTEDGVICTQSFVNVHLGRRGVELLADMAVGDAVDGLLGQDDDADLRQVHGIDRRGNATTYSGEGCEEWFGHTTSRDGDATAAGNMLANGETLDAALRGLDEPAEDLVDSLLIALERGVETGGDKRGHTSAAIDVWAPQTTAYHDLRVDAHDTPVRELRRVYEAAKAASDEFTEEKRSRRFD
ncbi:MAG: DUF1028 domain-containing protein [Halanaeroarchaeum sp.]